MAPSVAICNRHYLSYVALRWPPLPRQKTQVLSPAFVVTIAYWALLASSSSLSTPFNGIISFFPSPVRLITLMPPIYSLDEHIPSRPQLSVRSGRNFVDICRSDPLALPSRLHFHHRPLHRAGLYHSRKPELLPSVSPFFLLPSLVLTLLFCPQSLQVPRSKSIRWTGCGLCVRCPNRGMHHLRHRMGSLQT